MRLQDINPQSNSDYHITIEGLNNIYWTQFSGIKVNYSRPKYNDGLSNVMRSADGGTKEYEVVTISKPYDPEKDQPALDFIKQREDGSPFNMRLRPVRRVTNAQGTNTFRGNKAWDLFGCRISSWSCPGNVDTSDGSQTSTLEIQFTIDSAEFK
ncbi:hypothetical protein Nos7524_3207 [Nostoc sp. PCC 7524]|uniref:hypothetical protein n=1 Tax=Nostoc sp. (strain ATCC 29411 / PCC 7524) TaxID=28072 RepID=UPI00029F01FF|nr:hypothetical protein [Nostoc sp. PCC 7524]AFY49007.1 hypothetical protein Nos7524_3207 [Nostoc sp. PCC 7524]